MRRTRTKRGSVAPPPERPSVVAAGAVPSVSGSAILQRRCARGCSPGYCPTSRQQAGARPATNIADARATKVSKHTEVVPPGPACRAAQPVLTDPAGSCCSTPALYAATAPPPGPATCRDARAATAARWELSPLAAADVTCALSLDASLLLSSERLGGLTWRLPTARAGGPPLGGILLPPPGYPSNLNRCV